MNTAATKQHFITTVAYAAGHGDAELTCTTMDADRDGDRVMPQGAELANFLKNPVLLFSHQARDLPIGKVTSLQMSRTGIRARWAWVKNDPFADRVRNAWEQGALNSASIGFLPKEMRPNDFGGNDIEKWELLEISLCAIPANPMATRALKSLGLLTDHATALMPRDPGWTLELEDMEDHADVATRMAQSVTQAVIDAMAIQVGTALGRAYERAGVEVEEEETVFELEEDSEVEKTFDVDQGELYHAVGRAVGGGLVQIISEEIRSEMNYHLGRVD